VKDDARIKKEMEYWDRLCPGYDEFIEKNWKVYPSLVEKICKDVEGKNRILEVACGTGLVALEAASVADGVHGIDISPGMVEEAKKKAERRNIGNVEFSVEDAYALPFDESMFDAVICCNALHNMKHPWRALSEIRRVLNSGGMLLATIVGIGTSVKFKIGMTIYGLLTGLPVFHKLDADGAAAMIAESGFDVVNKETVRHPEDRVPIIYILAESVGTQLDGQRRQDESNL